MAFISTNRSLELMTMPPKYQNSFERRRELLYFFKIVIKRLTRAPIVLNLSSMLTFNGCQYIIYLSGSFIRKR